jgi:uncharacterized protein YqeY
MASVKERLRSDLTAAMKARDDVTTATIRMALAAIHTEEVSGAAARELSDDEVMAVLRREVKKRREAVEAYATAGRTVSAEREEAERQVLEAYLPKQLTDDELIELVREAISESGASQMSQMGPAMKAAQAKVAGRADGARVAAQVRRQLSGG